jgi:hypothetical protein
MQLVECESHPKHTPDLNSQVLASDPYPDALMHPTPTPDIRNPTHLCQAALLLPEAGHFLQCRRLSSGPCRLQHLQVCCQAQRLGEVSGGGGRGEVEWASSSSSSSNNKGWRW